MTALLVAPDSFKGTYPADVVATAIARDVPGADVCPVADGGEGTMEIVVRARAGTTTPVAAHDPLGRPIHARLGWIDGAATAIVEVARASGLGLVAAAERDAEASSTYGTGEMVATAIRDGARRVVVTMGGSATTDGGAGAIDAISARGGTGDAELIVVCDVTTPFERAAAVYAAQKGADPAAVRRLAARLDARAETMPRDPRGVSMTGAAGGLSGGLWATCGAALVPGAAWVLDQLDFDARLQRADAVVSGEGRLDAQTFEGKLVGEVARRCRARGKPLHLVVGSTTLTPVETQALGVTGVHVAGDVPAMTAAGRSIASVL